MLILAFESSAKAGSVALLQDGILLGESYENSGYTHSQTLMKLAQELLIACGKTAHDVTAVACAAGPGSFTGIRIGVAAAKGFAWGQELPCCGVSTLEAMAQNAGMFSGIVCCAMDARRQQVYNALFSSERGQLTRLRDDRALSLQELQADLDGFDRDILLLGDGAALCAGALHGRLLLAPEQLRMQRAGGVAIVAARQLAAGLPCDGATLIPNYLRLSQAERERLQREQQKSNHEGA